MCLKLNIMYHIHIDVCLKIKSLLHLKTTRKYRRKDISHEKYRKTDNDLKFVCKICKLYCGVSSFL